ncbi:MAG: carbohydrate kinase family protein [bacterium]|nr:carbohydrate kinase family protein [bacterium]
MNNYDILVIGRSCQDIIAVVDQFPRENQKLPLEFRLIEGGGQGGTASCCISKLGGRAAYVGRLGDDDEGRFCLKRLKDFGVATDFVDIVKGGKTPVAYVFITADSGARSIIYERNVLPKLQINNVIKSLIRQTGVALLDPEVTYLGGRLKKLAGSDFNVIYDCERWREGIEDIMNTADYFIPSSEFLEAEELGFHNLTFNEKIMKLKELVAGTLVMTHGEKGAYYIFDKTLCRVPVPDMQAVDTVGAGDNFHAAFALALTRGFDLHQMVKFSVAVASLSCREYGGRIGLPTWEQALEVTNKLREKIVNSFS